MATYVLGGVALASMGAFTYFAIAGKDRLHELQHDCAPECPEEQVEGGRTQYIIADVALGVGVASAIAAALVYFIDAGSSQSASGRTACSGRRRRDSRRRLRRAVVFLLSSGGSCRTAEDARCELPSPQGSRSRLSPAVTPATSMRSSAMARALGAARSATARCRRKRKAASTRRPAQALGPEGWRRASRDGGSDAMADAMTAMDASSDAAADGGDAAATPDGGGDAGCPVADRPDGVGITTTELGILSAPDFAPTRTPAGSAAIGNRLAFLFTLPDDAEMAAWTTKDELLSDMRFDDAPPLLPLFPASAGMVGPSGVIAPNDDELLVFFARFSILRPDAVGVARLHRNQPQTVIVHPLDQFLPLPPPDGNGDVPWHPVFSVRPADRDDECGIVSVPLRVPRESRGA